MEEHTLESLDKARHPPPQIHIGFSVPRGDAVSIPLHHTVASGITRLSGKTTTLQALIARSKLKAIVFRTKRGEVEFEGARAVPPFFRERSDWQYVNALMEATLQEKLKFERSWIIRATKGTKNLREVYNRIQSFLHDSDLREIDRNVFTSLAAYLELVLPQLEGGEFSRSLQMSEGLNVMDLTGFSPEVQQLVIRSTIEEILHHQNGVVVVVPEAQDFVPEGRNTPAKAAVRELVRKGGAVNVWLWLDTQTVSGVDKAILKQCEVWAVGRQRELNEALRAVEQLPLPRSSRPEVSEVMKLGRGQFFVCSGDRVQKTYVQPAWLDETRARRVAMGKEPVPEPPARDAPLVPAPASPSSEPRVADTPRHVEFPVGEKPSEDLEEDRAIFDALSLLPRTLGELQAVTGIPHERLRTRLRLHERSGHLRLGGQKRWTVTALGVRYHQTLPRPAAPQADEAEDDDVEEREAAMVEMDYLLHVDERERGRRQGALLSELENLKKEVLRKRKQWWKHEDVEARWQGATDDLLADILFAHQTCKSATTAGALTGVERLREKLTKRWEALARTADARIQAAVQGRRKLDAQAVLYREPRDPNQILRDILADSPFVTLEAAQWVMEQAVAPLHPQMVYDFLLRFREVDRGTAEMVSAKYSMLLGNDRRETQRISTSWPFRAF